ncbi:hypothetical protein BP5796_12351 [Coleophoma crateriformis]|uniref:Heterokaryon incompatibility domain-containing protein n=1 Tax=Coleophoma crateriformis TaxID=565419 RepID=A0A3D8Q9G6_9HELO|nr:hypothetical protein BP5796_12351 [Coleophoma crateriformis]
MNPFSYETSKLSHPHHIRVLKIHPAPSLDTPIRCDIEVVSLDNDPAYAALSYCWGNGDFDHSLTCDGQKLNITASLDEALRTFRQFTSPDRPDDGTKFIQPIIWADAVCINQNDFDEKNTQVPLMGRIYAQAKRVFIFLGEESRFTSPAIEFAKLLWTQASEFQEANKDLGTPEVLRKMPVPGENDPRWRALVHFLSRPWFHRCWIIQEFSMCPDRTFLWGNHAFQWIILDVVSRLILENSTVSLILASLLKTVAPQKPNPRFWDANSLTSLFMLRALAGTIAVDELFEIMHGRQAPRDRFSLWTLLMECGLLFDATNPRDKIYSLLGMASDANDGQLPKPDYRLTVETVFEQFARYFIEKGMGLDVIAMAGQERSSQLQEMPSWVPDFTTTPWPLRWSNYSNTKDDIFTAASELAPSITLHLKHISIRGAVIDEITKVGFGMAEAQVGHSSAHHEWIRSAQKIMSEVKPQLSTKDIDLILADIVTAEDPSGKVPSSEVLTAFNTLLRFTTSYVHMDIAMSPPTFDADALKYNIYMLSAVSIMAGTRFMVTKSGRVGLVPNPAKTGDNLCFFAGATVPYVLRDKGTENSYMLIGKAYVKGIMHGEILHGAVPEISDIHIR